MLLFLLRRIGLRHARLAPGQTALLVLILALGVGVFTAVRLANRAALSSFTHFTDTLTGRSDWIIQAPSGPLPISVLPELRTRLADLAVQIHPVVESTAVEPTSPDTPDSARFKRRTYTLLGVDIVAIANLASQQAATEPFFTNAPSSKSTDTARSAPGFFDLFAPEPLVWISPELSREPPAHLDLIINDAPVRLRVAGFIPHAPDAPTAPANLLVLDLPKLQSLIGREGRIDRIEFVLESGHALETRRTATGQRLEQLAIDESHASPRWLVSTPGSRRETAEVMTAAFRLNLTVLSLIALLVGLYLVFQALDGAVTRRRSEIAILRSLGVNARTIRLAWLAEAALLGLAGGALGLFLGWAGAQVAVRAVGQTVNALYFTTSVESASLSVPEGTLSLVAGMIASVIAGWVPARAAADTPPAQILVRSAPGAIGGRWLRSPLLAVGALGLGVVLVQLPPVELAGGTRFPLAGHIAAFCGILGGGVLAALIVPVLGKMLRPLANFFITWRIALGHIIRPTGRHRLAAAALVCAIGMAAGMAILVASFEMSVRYWVQSALQADLFISSSGAQSASNNNRLAPATWRALAAHPTVAHASVFTEYPVIINGKPTSIGGGDLARQTKREGFLWVGPSPATDALDPELHPENALVSESFSERFRIQRGDTVDVPTPAGLKSLRIAAVFADYGKERGTVLVNRTQLVRWFDDDHATSLALELVPGAVAETVRIDLQVTHPGTVIYTNSSLRAEVLRIFRQTFSITYALQLIGLFVAVTGLALSLVSVLLDRRDELTTLRAIGFRRSEIARSTAIEGGLLALCATATGLALSFGLGWLLIHVINKQSFGWTLAFAVPNGQLAALAILVIGTGVTVSYFVGRWASTLPADREE